MWTPELSYLLEKRRCSAQGLTLFPFAEQLLLVDGPVFVAGSFCCPCPWSSGRSSSNRHALLASRVASVSAGFGAAAKILAAFVFSNPHCHALALRFIWNFTESLQLLAQKLQPVPLRLLQQLPLLISLLLFRAAAYLVNRDAADNKLLMNWLLDCLRLLLLFLLLVLRWI